MQSELLLAACGAGVLHTLAGPDHYLPLIATARAASWSERRALTTTVACGLLHCGSAFALLVVGMLCSVGVAALAPGESMRANLAASLMIALGIAVLVTALRPRTRALGQGRAWPFLVLFALGPCEWLLPAGAAGFARDGFPGALEVCSVFTAATLATMVAAVFVGMRGLARLPLPTPRVAGALAGSTTLACGIAMLLGL